MAFRSSPARWELANADLQLRTDLQAPSGPYRTPCGLSAARMTSSSWTPSPSLSLLTVNALVAADGYIVPVQPHYLALEGLVNLEEAIRRVKEGAGTKARLLGLLLTLADYRTREVVELIRDHYKADVFKTEIRISTRLAEPPASARASFKTTLPQAARTPTGSWLARSCGD